MTTKNTDTEKKWREEFEALQFKYKNNLERSWNGYVDGEIHSRWIMYEAARKKAQEEIDHWCKFALIANKEASRNAGLAIKHSETIQSRDAEIVKLKEEIQRLETSRRLSHDSNNILWREKKTLILDLKTANDSYKLLKEKFKPLFILYGESLEKMPTANEIEKRDKLLEQAVGWLRNETRYNAEIRDQWLKDFEELLK